MYTTEFRILGENHLKLLDSKTSLKHKIVRADAPSVITFLQLLIILHAYHILTSALRGGNVFGSAKFKKRFFSTNKNRHVSPKISSLYWHCVCCITEGLWYLINGILLIYFLLFFQFLQFHGFGDGFKWREICSNIIRKKVKSALTSKILKRVHMYLIHHDLQTSVQDGREKTQTRKLENEILSLCCSSLRSVLHLE